MSEENVEIVRGVIDAHERRNFWRSWFTWEAANFKYEEFIDAGE